MDNKIRPEELRIGNWIKKKNPIFGAEQVKIINGDWVNLIPVDSIEGIPLSEEWLIRGGFKQGKGKNKSYYTIYLKESDSVLTLNWNETSSEIHSIGIVHPHIDTTLTNFCWHVKYLHRLQNIFYAICGEELKFNDPST